MEVSIIQEKIDMVKNRLSEINNLFNIYNINDKESIETFKEEINSYKELLKKINDEELNGTSK
jgi:archaellum component FlaC